MRPEELHGVAFTQAILILGYKWLVRTHDDMQRIYFAAVIDDSVFRDLYTDPFVFPFFHFLAIWVESRMDGITYIHRHGFLADENRVAMIHIKIRNDSQVNLYDRVTTAGCLVFERRKPSFPIGGIQSLALSNNVRKVVLTDGVEAEYVVSRVELNLNSIERIACEQCVAEDRIREIGYSVPSHAIRFASS